MRDGDEERRGKAYSFQVARISGEGTRGTLNELQPDPPGKHTTRFSPSIRGAIRTI